MKKWTQEVRLGQPISVTNQATERFQRSNPSELMIAPAKEYRLALIPGSLLPVSMVAELELDSVIPSPDKSKRTG